MKKFCAIALALTWGLPATLKAQTLYVINSGNNTIGEYGLDGSPLTSWSTGADNLGSLAVSGNDIFLSWGTDGDGYIAEYTTAGTRINGGLIDYGVVNPWGIAISGNNLYIASSGDNAVAEYTTSGALITYFLISGLYSPMGIAISGNDIFEVNGFGAGTVGEYTITGQTVNASLISGLNYAYSIAISGNDVFVANWGSGTIGEYTTSGATVNASLISGLSDPEGIAIFGNDLYVSSAGNGTIGEYTTSGTPINASLITGLDGPTAIAISPVPEPPDFALAVVGAAAFITVRRRAQKH